MLEAFAIKHAAKDFYLPNLILNIKPFDNLSTTCLTFYSECAYRSF